MSKKENIVLRSFFAGRTFVRGEKVDQIPKGFEKYFSEIEGVVEKVETPTENENDETTADETNPGDDNGSENGGNENNGVSDKNTVAEIKAFAEGEEIDLGDAGTKAEMLKVIAEARG